MTTANDDWTIQATDDLVIELWPPAPGNRADRLLLKLWSLVAERDGEDRAVAICPKYGTVRLRIDAGNGAATG